jgi:hypothetical protein
VVTEGQFRDVKREDGGAAAAPTSGWKLERRHSPVRRILVKLPWGTPTRSSVMFGHSCTNSVVGHPHRRGLHAGKVYQVIARFVRLRQAGMVPESVVGACRLLALRLLPPNHYWAQLDQFRMLCSAPGCSIHALDLRKQ